ncbi:CMP-N-acetylneuraminic acid synthetase [Brevinema andersonii]|uniref:CMP-N-acetylneuraminic acid synthetase n=1 Tax=Brevinema andersonii TaxID=34097 RepID=A0A1I1DIF4_BREAD|nr:acylneuraminate cytidylyltransferase family protein [Brevinema andersonii]SFB74701.1 CMP-N-acetylneuraminic acid synthetase [Brevinema andersonii]
MKNIAFLPLRGGSKSIILKNIKLLNGIPLAYYALDAAVACPYIEVVVVATDSDEIKTVIQEYASDKLLIIGRSELVSTDTSPTIDVLLEFAEQYSFETVTLIQATSPLVSPEDLMGGWALFQQGYDSVLSVTRQHRFIWDEQTRVPNYDLYNKPRRQDWKGILVENGAFYISSYNQIIGSKAVISGNIGLYEMAPETYVELDEPYDWIVMEQLIKNKN